MNDITDYIVEKTQLPIEPEQNDFNKKGYRMFNTGGVEAEVGEFLYSLVRLVKPNVVVETGTHYGISDVYIGLGLKKNGFGKLYTCDPADYIQARDLWAKTEVTEFIDYRVNRSLVDETFKGVEQIDILFLDSEPKFRFEEFDKYWDRVRVGGYIVIHDLDHKLSYGHYSAGMYCWPYGSFKDTIGKRLKNGECQSISFNNPRGMIMFQKVDKTFNNVNIVMRKNMNRSVLLPSVGDPVILCSWMKNFKKWQDLMDRVYVNLDYDPLNVTDEMKEANRKILNHPKIKVFEQTFMDHGPALRYLFNNSDDDVILFTEEDFYMTSKLILGEHLNKIDDRRDEVISFKRGSCSMEIQQGYQDRLGYTEGNLSPCYCVTRRDIVDKTDKVFEGRVWKNGEIIPFINHTVMGSEDACGDTFVNFTLQLREKKVNLTFDDRYYHGLFDRDLDKLQTPLNYTGIHLGSMSVFRGLELFSKSYNKEKFSKLMNVVQAESYKHEVFRRFLLYEIMVEKTAVELQMYEFHKNCLVNLTQIHEFFENSFPEYLECKPVLEKMKQLYSKIL